MTLEQRIAPSSPLNVVEQASSFRQYEVFTLPNGELLEMSKRKDNSAELLNTFLNAYENKIPIRLSQVEAIYRTNEDNNAISARNKLRERSLQAIKRLRIMLETRTNWTIFPDVRKDAKNGANPSLDLIEKNKIAVDKKDAAPPEATRITLPNGQIINIGKDPKIHNIFKKLIEAFATGEKVNLTQFAISQDNFGYFMHKARSILENQSPEFTIKNTVTPIEFDAIEKFSFYELIYKPEKLNSEITGSPPKTS